MCIESSSRATRYRWIGLIALMFLIVMGVQAQTITTGEITGTITDSTGAVVPNVTVTVKEINTGDVRTARSEGTGLYRLSLLKPGTYELRSAAPGLQAVVLTDVAVAVGRAVTLNLVLRPETSKEVVTVTDAAPLLQTENANMASSFSRKQVDLLPTPGGDITTVAFTVPGVVVSTGAGYGNFSSNGLPGTSNLFTTNGNDNMDPYLNLNNSGASNLTLGSNEVQEASVVQNGYSVQYGRQAGAQVNFITKSGTNAFHGNLLYNYNGSVMNANDFFANASDTPRGRAVSNQYGASLGGRIKRDKIFFFADTEGLRYVMPTSGVVSIPSQALQSYVLKTVSSSQAPLYQKAFALYNNAPGANRGVAVTNGDGILQDSNGAMGCGTLAGTPTGVGNGVFGENVSCANAFGTNVSNQNSEWLLSSRVDYNISDSHKIYFRFKTDHGLQPTNTDPLSPALNAVSNQPAYEGQVTYTSILSPRLVNNLIGSSSWYSATFGPADLKSALSAFPQQWQFFEGGANGTGSLTQVGLSNDTYPQGRRVGQLQIVDDLTYTSGKHTIKAGLNYRYNRVTDTGNQRLVYGGRYRFFGLDEFANGAIDPASGSTYAQRFTPYPVVHIRLSNAGFYLQDEWAATPQLKVTAGIRLDHTGNPGCTDNCFARMTQPFATVNKGSSLAYNQTIQTGLGNAFYDIQAISAQPRLGVVYNPTWAKDTVFRGGVGLFSDLFPATIAGGIFGNSPNVFTPSLRTGTVNTGGAGSAPAIAIATGTAFQNGFSNGATLSQLQASLAPVTFTPPAYSTLPSSVKMPTYVEWSFEVERQFGARNVLTLRYSGNHGYDEFLRNANVNGNYSASAYPSGFGGLPAAAPDPRFRIITDLTNNGWSNYHGMSLSYRRGMAYGITGQFSYTWSHSLDTISNGGLGEYFSAQDSLTSQIDPLNVRRLNYSNSDYDIRHTVTADFLWEIPAKFQQKALQNILGGWSLGTKWYARTSTPFSVYNSSLAGRVSAALGGTILAELAGPVQTSCTSAAVDTACFTAKSFQTTASQKTFGNLPRNSFRGPGYFDADMSIYKAIKFAERATLTLGGSAYNMFNHPNFANPDQNVAAGGLGLISSTVTPPASPYGSFQGSAVSGRVIVLTGKFSF
jgi:outer membrane receptor protein involved in Fe transport